MNNPPLKSVHLPQEVWDRILDILGYSGHPDASYCHNSLTTQLNPDRDKTKDKKAV